MREIKLLIWMFCTLCILVLTNSCTKKSVTAINQGGSLKYDKLGEYNIVEIDSSYIDRLTQEYNQSFNELPFRAKKSTLSSKYTAELSPVYLDTAFNVNVFETKRAYEIMLSSVFMEHSLSGKPVPIANNNRSLVEASVLSLEDGYFINHQQKIVIGDTLYHFKDGTTVEKTNLLTDVTDTEEVSLNYVAPEPPGGGGAGGYDPGPCDGYNNPVGLYTLGRYIVDEVVTDAFGDEWDVRLAYGNAAYTDSYFIRRSRTMTVFSFKVHGSDQLHYYEGEPRLWYNPPDLPPFASSRFPNSHVDANMEYSSRQGLELSCNTRIRGASGEFAADRIKGRCPNTGVVSWHNASLGGQTFLKNVCVE